MGPRLLDLFCGAGGASKGYAEAGFEVTGVDLTDHPDYPYRLIVADALTVDLGDYDVIHASPPCQAYTTMSNRHRGTGGTADEHPELIHDVRCRLLATGLPYVIENVPGARRDMHSPLTLTGGMFGLGVHRPRLFESNLLLHPPAYTSTSPPVGAIGVYGKLDGRRVWTRVDGTEQRVARTVEEAREAMGIDWMGWDDLREAIPPAYTRWLGCQILEQIGVAA